MLLGNNCYAIQCPTPSNVYYMAKDDHFAKFHAFVTYTSITAHFNTTPLLTGCSCVAFVLHNYHDFCPLNGQ